MSAILENLMVLLLIGFYLVLLAFAGLFVLFVIDRAVTGIFLTGIDKRPAHFGRSRRKSICC
jgi:hypothetical protein